jgi:hypothetical protein
LLRLALTPRPFDENNVVVTAFCFLCAALVAVRHAGNIRRLIRGEENRLKDSPAMLHISKILHVAAVGLWFGAIVMFTVVGALLLPTFASLTRQTPRPLFLPPPVAVGSSEVPDSMREEQKLRIFGAAVTPLFPWFFGIQIGCGVVALATALGWAVRVRRRMDMARVVVLLAAAACLGAGLWFGQKVSDLQRPRDESGDVLLIQPDPRQEEIAQAAADRAEFNRWHGYSLYDNFAVLLFVAVATGMAAFLPAGAGLAAASEGSTQTVERDTKDLPV